MLSFCRLSPGHNQAPVIQSGTRNLPHSTYAEFSKHVCLQWLNPLGYYGTKSPPDPPKNRLFKALFMSGLWGESNRPKDSVDRGFSTCYHWGHIPKDPIGQRLNKSPFHGWLIETNGWGVRRRREEVEEEEEEEKRELSPVRWRVGEMAVQKLEVTYRLHHSIHWESRSNQATPVLTST